MMRWYVGYKVEGGREAFKSDHRPTAVCTHIAAYGAVWGPFRTKRGAMFGALRPGFVVVADAERAAAERPMAPLDCGCDACVMPSRRYATEKPIAHVPRPRPFVGSAVIILSDDDVARVP